MLFLKWGAKREGTKKHLIQAEANGNLEEGGAKREGTKKHLIQAEANGNLEEAIFPVQLTTSRLGKHTC